MFVKSNRHKYALFGALVLTVPGLALRLTNSGINHQIDALFFGLAIVGSAFLLSWAAEVAQLDISAGLAIAVLAFIAVLPEYAVDLVFARKGGNAFQKFGPGCKPPGSHIESSCSLALANMTGSNRLLIGVGWSLVVLVAWWQWRKRGKRSVEVTLERGHTVELSFLAAATVYSLILPFRHSITLFDATVLVALFIGYTVRIARAPTEEPDLVGPAEWLGGFPTPRRRAIVVALFALAASIILLCAEHFADALVATGATFHIREFFLVQWLAPFASEAPELLVAGMYAWRLNASAGLGTLVSSKVNQWTLLVGTLPIAFALTSGSLHGLPIIPRQREELLLTAAQSLFALAVLANLSISVKEALLMLGLFLSQFAMSAVVPEQLGYVERLSVSGAYLALAVFLLIRGGREFPSMVSDGIRAPYSELSPPK